ncbi:DUF6895 family protein [Frankia tisae]|uniref:DUF6895 family protein n=1 Tax=Frankia tisae TaxID=2950104 RepID=UPI0035582448
MDPGAGDRLRGWIETHSADFRPDLRSGLKSFGQVRAFGELSMVLWALTGPRHRAAGSRYAAWAQDVAAQLWPDLEVVGEHLPWDDLPQHHLRDLLVMFPVLEEVTHRRSRFHDKVVEVLGGGFGTVPAEDLKIAFARDTAGLGDCRPAVTRELAAELSAWPGTGAAAKSSWLYTITHMIFYATRFGAREVSWPAAFPAPLGCVLGSCAAARLATRDYDIAAELLASIAWSGSGISAAFLTGVSALAAIAQEQGSVPVRPPSADGAEPGSRSGPGFKDRYHATIVTLAVLAEGELATGTRAQGS